MYTLDEETGTIYNAEGLTVCQGYRGWHDRSTWGAQWADDPRISMLRDGAGQTMRKICDLLNKEPNHT